MPFERYLTHPQDPAAAASSSSSTGDYAYVQSGYSSSMGPALDSLPSHPSLHLQLPQFMLAGPPTLAPGGGAEVLPGPLGYSWLANSGFTHKGSEDFFTHPSFKSYSPSHFPQSDYHPQPQSVPFEAPHPLSGTILPQPPSPLPPLSPRPVVQPEDASPTLSQDPTQWGASFSAPSSLGLPVYSSSGFDLLSILGRIANRPNPSLTLGPVDMSCSFVVVDVRRYDTPIIYASPSFCSLTGYAEHEVLGRNCRFLQAPGGRVTRGERRQFAAPEAVSYMKKSLGDDKECQVSLINYRKDGSAFINLVTVIPVSGGVNNGPEEQNDVVFHVGFQVDLTEQPNAILQKLKDGSYMVDYSSTLPHHPGPSIRDRRNHGYVLNAVSQDLREFLSDPSFVSSLSTPASSAEEADAQEGNHPLSLILLNAMPDSLLVLSLKGSFLYVAPSISRALGYPPEELCGKSVVDYCHPSDCVPLTRELKESSATLAAHEGQGFFPSIPSTPRIVNLLFRAKAQNGTYMWIECTGRLHVEPGKGRKAIILSARSRTMPRLGWKVAPPDAVRQDWDGGGGDVAREVWGMLSVGGTVLFMSANVKTILGWGVGEIIGMSIDDLTLESSPSHLAAAISRAAQGGTDRAETVECQFRQRSGEYAMLSILLYPLPTAAVSQASQTELRRLPIICQIKPPSAKSTVQRQLVTTVSKGNMFSESDDAQESSWQYELQQLKIENQKLVEEIEKLESSAEQEGQQRRSVSLSLSSSHMRPTDWTLPPAATSTSQHHSLKRRWEPRSDVP
ncbi:hypothetical protein BC834DRAFT_898861 [Gloeopeniophorella convolvens]|nr:hypothetical protein BC834DRAFT_898861 [Gloeopeniophorella convolvens]